MCKFYVSRRSWIHGDKSNIGTDYTSRRCMVNETELVEYLQSKGYAEIFPELMTVKEKISVFKIATDIVGPIGGGLVNVLFSPPETKLTAIISPGFLDINYRFLHSINKVDLRLFTDTHHIETTEFKKYMRVKFKDIIGEIESVNNDNVLINYTDYNVAGWNSDIDYKMIVAPISQCKKLDNGLNSAWEIDLDKFKEIV